MFYEASYSDKGRKVKVTTRSKADPRKRRPAPLLVPFNADVSSNRKNMKNALSKIIIAIVWLVPLNLSAAQKTIRLICEYTHSIDGGKSIDISGEDLITINYSEGGRAVIEKTGFGGEFVGTLSEEQIYGVSKFKMKDLTARQTLTINRFTGAFEITFFIEGSKGSLVQYGKCKPATEKLF